jgi:hypothetical protein
MAVPTLQLMSNPDFRSMMDVAQATLLDTGILDSRATIFDHIFRCKPPKFRKVREVHARRARQLRKRGEDVWFLRWQHGHCIYGWGGKRPTDIITFRLMPRKQSEPVYTPINYVTNLTLELV